MKVEIPVGSGKDVKAKETDQIQPCVFVAYIVLDDPNQEITEK